LAELLPVLVHEARAVRLHLRPLEPDALRLLVRGRCALAPDDEARLAGHLHRRAGGNPLLALELLHALEAGGVLRGVGCGAWELGPLDGLPLPRAVRQIVGRRVARLGGDAPAQLAVAAVLGREVSLSHWLAAADAPAEAVACVVERATAAGVLAEAGDGPEL